MTTENVFADSTDADAAVRGIYINMMQSFGLGFSSGAITAYAGLSSDELYQSKTDINTEFYANNISKTNSTISVLWRTAYSFLYNINACIEGINNSTSMSQNQKNVLIGEVKCIRAFIYFNLVNLFGDIPMPLTTDYKTSRLLSRTSVEKVYNTMVEDLKSAKSLLPKSSARNTRANYYAATALLSRLYLYQNKYDLATAQASEIINSSNFSLESDLNNVFIEKSKETIWSLQPVFPGKDTWEGYYFIPSSTSKMPTFIITDSLFNSFEAKDERKNKWIQINTIAGQQYPIPFKYHNNKDNENTSEVYVVLRLAEQYLIRAEAEANLNKIAAATSDLNTVRNRAGLENCHANNKDSVLFYIQRERRWELMYEWGSRWFDLKRTHNAEKILGKIKENFTSADLLYPIPQNEIDRDPNITQNEGY